MLLWTIIRPNIKLLPIRSMPSAVQFIRTFVRQNIYAPPTANKKTVREEKIMNFDISDNPMTQKYLGKSEF